VVVVVEERLLLLRGVPLRRRRSGDGFPPSGVFLQQRLLRVLGVLRVLLLRGGGVRAQASCFAGEVAQVLALLYSSS